ncbi:tyrosine-type recombinase/integrase [Flavobacterium macrobrachii]|uniref:Tyrosine-type recombinase/integrase n=1 Tax=Flavobacterium macrobrachii TaxID=591204 RepID=A0ABS2CU43_9FLAO|nr:tyrosine-type recombinase/integrase [Flavobacterium macrobrachii]MBM6498074.1 tyrosine-type recombinase/integrase [Flavobacterium macrobrachii]
MNFKTYLKQQELSKTTAEMYHYQTMNFISFLDKDNTEVENCTEKEIMLYLAHLQKQGIASETRKLRLSALKHFFNFQIENNQRKDNPANRIKLQGGQKQKLYPILSPQELQNIYENYTVPKEDDPRSHHNWFNGYRLSKERNKVIIGLLFNQGITTAEVSRITTDSLDLRNGKIDITGGRTGKDRTLELKSSQIMDLMEYQYKTRNELLKYHKEPTKQLFLSTPASGQTQVNDVNAFNIFKRLTDELKEQNPKFINFLQVRASVITYWLKNYNLRQVQYFAGHKRIISTEMYLINDIDDLQKEIDNFHPIG